MQTRRLTIKERNREHPVWVVSADDFTCEPGAAINPEVVRDDPSFSLYCLDWERQMGLFVETPVEIDLTRAPFYYQAQAEHLTGMVEMPLETFHQMAETISLPKKGLVFIHSTGRCGSTLISKVLEAAPEVNSLSEPDAFTQLVIIRDGDASKDAVITEALKSAVAWHCKPRRGQAPELVAIKTRSEVVEVAELMSMAYPEAKNLFLYRDMHSWIQSIYRIGRDDRPYYDVEMNRQMENGFAKMNPLVAKARKPEAPMHPMQIWALNWVAGIERYRNLQAQSYTVAAMRYADIVGQPDWMVAELSGLCGIEISDSVTLAQALERDSQEGTTFSRKELGGRNRQLAEEIREECAEIVRSHGEDPGPGMVLPGTVLPPSPSNATSD